MSWALRVIGAAALVAVFPGIFAVLAWKPRADLRLLELAGIGIGISAALVQLLSVGAVMYSWPIEISLGLLAAWTVAHAVFAVRRRGSAVHVSASPAELALCGAILLLGGALYLVGSPFDTTEPRIHISLVRRLVHLSSPTPYNIYVAPDVVYTYPFPGTHYLLALMARAGDIDPFFLYYKTRAVWGVAAAAILYGCALAIFRHRRVALASAFVAIALTANGAFGAVPNFSWGQLAPLSHASDIAMGVLLPALLLLTFNALSASERREQRFFIATTLALAAMLSMVHPREIVQYLVYLTAFAAAAVFGQGLRPMARQAAVLVVATLALLLLYQAWQHSVVLAVDDIVERERSGIAEVFQHASIADLLGLPMPLLRNYMIAFQTMFHGSTVAVLLASPFALFAMRRWPLALFTAAGIACYLLIIRFPLLAIPYAYLSYFEILYTPVRNIIFFIHILAGVCLYLAAARISRYPPAIAVAAALAISAAVWAINRFVAPFLTADFGRADILFIPVLAGYAATVWWGWSGRGVAGDDAWVSNPHPRWRLAMVALIIPLVVATESSPSSLRHVSWRAPATPADLFASLPCLGGGEFCPPPRALLDLIDRTLPTTAVLAVDIADEYQPSLFVPQQMVAWPGTAEGLLPRVVFAKYFERYDRAKAAHDAQPFFNDRESELERLAFVRDLGVTHVLVNPRTHAMMTAVLGAASGVFTPLYDDGRWALYEVVPRYRGLRL